MNGPRRAGRAALELPSDGPAFTEPWQARNFAIAVALRDAGVISWPEWTRALGARLALRPDYHLAWAEALEDVLRARGLLAAGQLEDEAARWHDAAARTPHGEPITLAVLEDPGSGRGGAGPSMGVS